MSGTWELVLLPSGKSTIGRWAHAIKVGLDIQIGWLKVHLLARVYTYTFGLDCSETFPAMANIAFVCLFYTGLLLVIDLFFIWILRIIDFIWSNHLVLLLGGVLWFGILVLPITLLSEIVSSSLIW